MSTLPLLRDIDAVVVRVPDLDAALDFYCAALGHEVAWRTERAVGLNLGDVAIELVLSLDHGPETDLLVASVDDAVQVVQAAGGSLVAGPEEIDVGWVAVVRDPFGNQLTIVDLSKGRYLTDTTARVIGLAREAERSDDG